MKKVIINGMVYAQKPTGIYRYANEILLELDKQIQKDEIELIIPKYVKNYPEFRNIKIIRYGNIKGILWEQISLPFYLLKNNVISVNFTNSMPLLVPGIIVIHDVGYRINPSFYNSTHGKLAMIWHRLNYRWASMCKTPIITVTEYSKSCISKYYQVDPEMITVIGNAWQHILRINEDEDALDRYDLKEYEYYFTLGSVSKRKNIEWIYKAAKIFPNELFVVAGGIAKNSSYQTEGRTPNVKLLGYITDNEIKMLMRKCKAFIFPSFFEGFGIPPLEALALEVPVIVSEASCLPELYKDSVTYIDPYSVPDQLVAFFDKIKADEVLGRFSWKKSAYELLSIIRSV